MLGALRLHLRALGSFSLDTTAPADPKAVVSGLRALVDEDELGPLVTGVPFLLRKHGREELLPAVDAIVREVRGLADFIEALPEEAARARLNNVEERLSGMLQGIQAFVDADHVELGPADLPEQGRSDTGTRRRMAAIGWRSTSSPGGALRIPRTWRSSMPS